MKTNCLTNEPSRPFLLRQSTGRDRSRGRIGRRRAATVGGGLALLVVIGATNAALIHTGVMHSVYLHTIISLALVAVISIGLNSDAARSARLVRELQRSESALRRSEQRLDHAAETGQFGIWEWDVAGDRIWATAPARALAGLDTDGRLVPGRVLDAVHPEDRETVLEGVRRALADGSSYEWTYRVLLPDGQLRWICTRGGVEVDACGTRALLRGVSMDVTERKQAERELARLRGELAHLARITMLSELSGSLAHELNQPLTAILSNAQAGIQFLAQDPPNVAELRDILQDIASDDKRAGDVIKGLRMLLKRGEMRQEPLDLNQLVRDVLRLMRSDMLNSGVALATEFAPGLPPVQGDRVQLQQVMINLMVNGCDAMVGAPVAERQLVVSIQPAAGNRVCVRVTDHGRGIAPDDLERVFDPFFTTKEHGLGLGLSVCRTIIAAHGGRLSVSNDVGGGACFQFALPLIAGSGR